MMFFLPREKVEKLRSLCQRTLTSSQITLRDLSALIGKLRATSPAIFPAPLQLRGLQQDLVQAQQQKFHYDFSILINEEGREELNWLVKNLDLWNGSPLQFPPPDLTIFSDAAKTGGWGAACQGKSTGGVWSEEESNLDINMQELLAAELAILTFTKDTKPKSIHLRIDNTTALSYLTKMGGTKCPELTKISKRIWSYLFSHGITLTVEWISTKLNTRADFESRNVQDSSEWKLCPDIFRRLCQRLGQPNLDLFASRTSHQLPRYISWKDDPQCWSVGAFQQEWTGNFPYAFPPQPRGPKVLYNASLHNDLRDIDRIITQKTEFTGSTNDISRTSKYNETKF